jgi:hypothetical protein
MLYAVILPEKEIFGSREVQFIPHLINCETNSWYLLLIPGIYMCEHFQTTHLV